MVQIALAVNLFCGHVFAERLPGQQATQTTEPLPHRIPRASTSSSSAVDLATSSRFCRSMVRASCLWPSASSAAASLAAGNPGGGLAHASAVPMLRDDIDWRVPLRTASTKVTAVAEAANEEGMDRLLRTDMPRENYVHGLGTILVPGLSRAIRWTYTRTSPPRTHRVHTLTPLSRHQTPSPPRMVRLRS